jgi:S1-C subfamily serine protease
MTGEWTAPKMSVSSPVLNKRLDQFSYNGSGIAGGDSGGPVIDLNGQLVGIHQGDVDGTRDGWAQRMQEVVATLSGPTMG